MKILNKKEENFLFLEEEWTNPVAENGVYKSTHTAMCTCGFHKKYTECYIADCPQYCEEDG